MREFQTFKKQSGFLAHPVHLVNAKSIDKLYSASSGTSWKKTWTVKTDRGLERRNSSYV